ncbi:LssY C-terminal domain-containing protein [Lactococcus lactis]|nr:LssY C-terminal domain-containing protein [Lactococcus lactis]
MIIPNITKIITKIYLPEYFIGRSRTSDGVLGDSVNLLIDGSKEDIEAAFLKMGWTKSDKITLRSSLKIIKSSLLHQSYPTAPVSSLFLFSKNKTSPLKRKFLAVLNKGIISDYGKLHKIITSLGSKV